MSYIYILTNSSLEGQIKVGMTTREVKQRAKELSTTGLPAAFEVAAYWSVAPHLLQSYEKQAHRALNKYRVSKSREFFLIGVEKAKHILSEIIKSPEQLEEEIRQAHRRTIEAQEARRVQLIDKYKREIQSLAADYSQLSNEAERMDSLAQKGGSWLSDKLSWLGEFLVDIADRRQYLLLLICGTFGAIWYQSKTEGVLVVFFASAIAGGIVVVLCLGGIGFVCCKLSDVLGGSTRERKHRAFISMSKADSMRARKESLEQKINEILKHKT